MLIEHHEPGFTAHLTIMLDGKPFDSRFELLSDGREVTETYQGRPTVSSLRWDGDALWPRGEARVRTVM